MRRNAIETLLGGVVMVVAIAFLFFALDSAQVRGVQGYEINAVFYKIGGLSNGSDVRINGIKVGTVTDSRLNAKTFDAEVKLSPSCRAGRTIPERGGARARRQHTAA